MSLARHALYFESAGARLFSWYHADDSAPAMDCVAVICNPIGFEYSHSHRSLRHLADRLARIGVPALRFDYHGTGDSPGTDTDPDRLGTWQLDIAAAIRTAKDLSGRERVCVVGLRLGAMLASLVAAEIAIDLLVLWAPPVTGRQYVREMRAVAAGAAPEGAQSEGPLESGGFVLSDETSERLREIDLRKRAPLPGTRVLVAGRDDFPTDRALDQAFTAAGIETHFVVAPGYAGMMSEPQFTILPEMAFDEITTWIGERAAPSSAPLPPVRNLPSTTTVTVRSAQSETILEESTCRFGAENHLFGILTRPAGRPYERVVVLYNAGCVHHVGPNRIYVSLARQLAATGYACLRFDLEGIGDSVLRGPGRENHPYPENAVADARSALDFLKSRGEKRFVALGLCSGAHTAFHAGVRFSEEDIEDIVLINPLTFYWHEGMSLETTRRYFDLVAYRQSARDPKRWLKLLRGRVDMGNLMRTLSMHAKSLWKSHYDEIREIVRPATASPLSRDLQKLFSLDRRITMIVAEGDPGVELLMASARRTAKRALKSGRIRLFMIDAADHTFSRAKPRQDLMARMIGLFAG
jgi:alpha-beta hydrolase superfamily lysophospholipase